MSELEPGHPLADREQLLAEHAAEIDDAEGEGILQESTPPDVEDEAGLEPETVTSHVLYCGGTTKWSKSTFVCHSTDVVYYRVAFYDANLFRLWISNWVNKGSHAGGTTLLQWGGLANSRVRRALVLWHHEGLTYRRWASC